MTRRRKGRSPDLRLSELTISNRLLFWSVIFTLFCSLVLGGAPAKSDWRFGLIFLSGLWLLCAAIWQGALSEFRNLSLASRLFVGGVVLLPVLQIIPLPPAIWHSFPGRELEHQILDIVGYSNAWLSMSLEPLQTQMVALMLVPLLGLFLASLKLTDQELQLMLIGVVALIIVSAFVGAFQLLSGGSLFQMYNTGHRGLLLGFFANRNHMGTLLAIGILVGGFLASRFAGTRALAIAGGIVFALLMLTAILGTASRAGLALGLAAVILSVPFYAGLGGHPVRNITIGSVLALLGGMGLLASSNVIGKVVDRYDLVGEDLRWSIWLNSWSIAKNYFPMGSGFGTFNNIYRSHEKLEWLLPVYINHAHSDYIEIFIEAGLPAVLLFFVFLWVLFESLLAAARLGGSRQGNIHLLGVAIIGLYFLHSFVDYPLRTAALAAVFSVAFSLLVRSRARLKAL